MTALLLFFLVALLYSSVGHAGASGYLAVMTLYVGLIEKDARPTALVLNIVVASIGTLQFAIAKQIAWRELLPYVFGSVPLAFYGGTLKLDDETYKLLVGGLLIFASVRLLIGLPNRASIKSAHDIVAIMFGIGIGLLAGLTGTGGGIFLTPVLILFGYASPRRAAGLSVAFILANSIAGLAGRSQSGFALREDAWSWGVAAVLGGIAGSWFGANRSGLATLRRLLAMVLLIAAGKLIYSAIAP